MNEPSNQITYNKLDNKKDLVQRIKVVIARLIMLPLLLVFAIALGILGARVWIAIHEIPLEMWLKTGLVLFGSLLFYVIAKWATENSEL